MDDGAKARPEERRATRRSSTARTKGPIATAPAAGDDVAPHVRVMVARLCGGDVTAVAEMLTALGSEQRRGWRALPDPLPAIPALEAHARCAAPRDADPERVLMLALCGTGPVRALGPVVGCEPDRILRSPLLVLTERNGGRFSFADEALRVHVLAESTVPERLRAHQRLALVLVEAGDADGALWHRACGAVAGDPALVGPLIGLARSALRGGDAGRALRYAREAVEHARPGSPEQAGALLWAGRAALSGGWVADAVEYSEQALRLDAEGRGEASAAFVLAHALRHGVVPSPESLVPADATGSGYGHAAALGASLSAERGDRERGASWLAVGARIGQEPGDRATRSAWRDTLAGEDSRGAVTEGDAVRRVLHALGSGLDGDPDRGARAPTRPAAPCGDPVLGLQERSPLLRARRAVAEVLLHVWAGRIGTAHALLATSAEELPVALPFAGLGVALSRRLDLAVDGRIGGLSRGLAAAVPWSQELDGFVDRAFIAYLHGRSDEAAVHMSLWADRGRPGESLGLPWLDEIGPLGTMVAPAPEPPEAGAARMLRTRIRAARESSWRTDFDAVAEESRGILSPFERARVEALLGSTCAARGDRGRGVRHLHAARSLFEESGARAWRGMVDRRLRLLTESREHPAGETRPVPSPLEVCRAMWEPVLTARELEVALMMAEGRTNREIALALHVSVRTVEVHGGRIFSKLDVRTRHELTVLALRTDQHL